MATQLFWITASGVVFLWLFSADNVKGEKRSNADKSCEVALMLLVQEPSLVLHDQCNSDCCMHPWQAHLPL